MVKRGRPSGKTRKRVKLMQRRKQLIDETRSIKNHKSKLARLAEKKKNKKDGGVKYSMLRFLTPEHRVLLVGEGDFSFSRALVRIWEQAANPDAVKDVESLVGFNMVSTCYDSKETLVEKYPEVKDVVREIKASGVTVHAGIDATRLIDSKRVVKSLTEICNITEGQCIEDGNFGFDRIVFNFPHTGCGIKDTEQNNQVHREMLEQFFLSAQTVLAPGGLVFVTVKVGEPYDSWRIPGIAVNTGFTVHSSLPFNPSVYPGYQHRRTVGARSDAEPNVDIDNDKRASRTLVFVYNKDGKTNEGEGDSDSE